MFQRFSLLSSRQEARQHMDKQSVEDIAESSKSWLAGRMKRVTESGLCIWSYKAYPQWYTSSSKATPPDNATHCDTILIQTTTVFKV